MKFQVVGCSHHQTNVELRERLAFSESQVKPLLNMFYDAFPKTEAVLLSTCNRTELYTAARQEGGLPNHLDMIEFLAGQSGVEVSKIQADLFVYEDRNAIEHLFSVAASLDSMVIGEAQILSQVKRAYQLATEQNPDISLSHQVFQYAIRVARRVSNETDLHQNRVSIPSVAIGVLAKQIFERLTDKRILVLGAGEMADETLRYIQAEGGKEIIIVNRTRERAEELAKTWNGKVSPWSELENELASADLIVSTTGAQQPVVTEAMFLAAEPIRRQKPLFVLDLALPRDFDASISERENVYLYTLDDLQRECEHNRKSRQSQYPKAIKIVQQETNHFIDEIRRRSSGTAIAQLRQQVNEVKQSELDRLWNRIEDLEPKHKSEIEQAFNRLVNKILHPPVKSVQSDSKEGSGGLLEALKKLFQLGD